MRYQIMSQMRLKSYKLQDVQPYIKTFENMIFGKIENSKN